MTRAEERENIRNYAKQSSSSSRASFGDLLGEQLAKLKEQAAAAGDKKEDGENKS
jgi:hypothetical protein